MDAVDVLMEARAYIEKGWCQLALAEPETADADVRHASAWCIYGAVVVALADEDRLAQVSLFDETRDLLEEVVEENPAVWNDIPDRTQEEVLEAFNRAIALGLERAGER